MVRTNPSLPSSILKSETMMLPTPLMCAVVILAASVRIAHAFAPSVSILPSSSSAAAASVGSSGRRHRHPPPAHHHGNDDDRVDDRIRRRGRCGDPSSSSDDDDDAAVVASRDRRFLVSSAASAMATSVLPLVAIVTTTTFAVAPPPSNALVKGNAPPPKRRPAADDGGGGGEQQGQQPPRCRNVEECQETAEREGTLRAQREAATAASGPKPRIAPGGTKYLDVVDEAAPPPAAATATAAVAKMGDVADVHYRVLKIGKRSYDGLSGEGTVVFSRGYALEDDERVIGDRSFRFAIGDDRVIKGEFPRPSSSADGAPGVFFAHRPPTM